MAQAATMDNSMGPYWWLVLIQGIVATLFGIFTIVHPDLTLKFLGIYFGLFLLIIGAMDIIAGVSAKSIDATWVLRVILGTVLIGLGVYLLQRPELSVASFIVYVAISLIIRGVMDIVFGLTNDSDNGSKWLGVIVGVLAIIAGIVIWRYPIQGTLAFVWVLGFWALVAGPIWIAMSLKLKELQS